MHEETIHLVLNHHQRVIALGYAFSLCEGIRHVQDCISVHPSALVVAMPHSRGQVEPESLCDQDERYPLVVGEGLAFLFFVLFRDLLLIREIVGISHPAVCVGVISVSSREVCWRPAGDGVGMERTGSDQDGEGDDDDDGVLVAETVYGIIVSFRLRPRDFREYCDNAIHGAL